jgi:hypothetical protein
MRKDREATRAAPAFRALGVRMQGDERLEDC